MPNKIRFFNEILWSNPVNEMIGQLEESSPEDIVVDLFTYGGEVQPTWTLYKAIKEYEGETTVEVDGLAASMGTIVMAAFKKRRVSNTAKIMIHAPIGSFGDEEKDKEINQSMYEALKAVIDENKFKELKGISLKKLIFQKGEERQDIWLNAKEMKQIGFATETYNLTAQATRNVAELIKGKSINNTSLAAVFNFNQNNTKMTYDELKNQEPALFEKIRNEGIEAGIKQEGRRTAAALAWLETDEKAVLDAIENNDEIDSAFISQMSAKAAKKATLKGMEEEDSGDTDTDEVDEKPEAISKETKAAADATIERLTGKKS